MSIPLNKYYERILSRKDIVDLFNFKTDNERYCLIVSRGLCQTFTVIDDKIYCYDHEKVIHVHLNEPSLNTRQLMAKIVNRFVKASLEISFANRPDFEEVLGGKVQLLLNA